MDQSAVQLTTEITTFLDLSDWITTIATVVLAGLTFLYVRLTKRLVEALSDPCVTIQVAAKEDSARQIQLVVQNSGNGIAYDINFGFSRPLPFKSKQEARNGESLSNAMASGPLIVGIPALGPGERRKIRWGDIGFLSEAIGDEPIIATCKFRKNNKDMTPITCPLEVNSLFGTTIKRSPTYQLSRDIEKISRKIEYLTTGFSKLHVAIDSFPLQGNEDDETGQ